MLYNLNLLLKDEEVDLLKELKGTIVSKVIFDRSIEKEFEYSHIGFTVLTFTDKGDCIVISQEDTNKEYPESGVVHGGCEIRQDYPRFRIERSNIKDLGDFKYCIMTQSGLKVVGKPVWEYYTINSDVESIRIIRDVASWNFGVNTWKTKVDIGIEILLSKKSILSVLEDCKGWMYSVFFDTKNTEKIINKFWNPNNWGMVGKVDYLYREIIQI